MGRLDGKTALITGAAQGIGAAIASAFRREGASLILSDIADDQGRELAQEIGAEYWHLDVASEDDWAAAEQRFTDSATALDILVNNAGITGLTETSGPHDPEHLDTASWQRVMDVNALGTAFGCRMALRLMKRRGGSIINMSSRSGLVGIPGAAAYAASKAAIRNHTKSVALYAAECGYYIRCNSIHPAAILTPMWDPMLGDTPETRQNALDQIAGDIPLGRVGAPADVADAAVFLAADESRYITGTELNIDGGLLAGTAARPKART